MISPLGVGFESRPPHHVRVGGLSWGVFSGCPVSCLSVVLVFFLSWVSGGGGGVFFHRLWVLGLVGVPGFVAGVFGVGMPVCFFSGLDNH